MSAHIYPAWTVAQPFATLDAALEAAEARYKVHNSHPQLCHELADIWRSYE